MIQSLRQSDLEEGIGEAASSSFKSESIRAPPVLLCYSDLLRYPAYPFHPLCHQSMSQFSYPSILGLPDFIPDFPVTSWFPSFHSPLPSQTSSSKKLLPLLHREGGKATITDLGHIFSLCVCMGSSLQLYWFCAVCANVHAWPIFGCSRGSSRLGDSGGLTVMAVVVGVKEGGNEAAGRTQEGAAIVGNRG